VIALGLVALAACNARSTASDGTKTDAARAAPDPIAELRPYEEETRRAFDFARPPSAETGMGADPWAVRRVPAGWVGILRGRSSLVLLDDELREMARVPAPRSPTGLAVAKNGDLLVVGELSASIGRFAVRGRSLVALGEARVPGVTGLRDVAVSPAGVVWAVDDRGGRLLRVGLDDNPRRRAATVLASLPVGHGAAQVLATANHVVVDSVTDHVLTVFATDASGDLAATPPVRITHDGPMWGFDARETERGLVVVAGGVEDRPLDRTGGFFGFIDSFVFAYRVHEGAADPLATVNVSEHGVVTPKALAIETVEDRIDVLVTAYGSASGVRIALRAGSEPSIAPAALVPGIRAVARSAERTVMADPLLDSWVALDDRGVRVVPVARPAAAEEGPERATASRLGEALFFTTLMAPANTSAGAHSRFTCETCHFEGYVDGRTHHTGREDVHATTKPLVGLVGNRPYFSRALDPDLATISHAEFRVAGAGSGTDPFFSVEPSSHRWLEHLGVSEGRTPLELRRALMRFLTDFSHRPNPAVLGRAAFEPLEREGARVFRDRCEGCHAARLAADDPSSRVAFEQWEALVLAEAAPIVWARDGYERTGVTPYVHERGARPPSLRRLSKKHPYFTNGSARSVEDVLDGVRFVGAETFHANAPGPAARLDDASKRALRAFLELL
jgi:hypothetical protein